MAEVREEEFVFDTKWGDCVTLSVSDGGCYLGVNREGAEPTWVTLSSKTLYELGIRIIKEVA